MSWDLQRSLLLIMGAFICGGLVCVIVENMIRSQRRHRRARKRRGLR